MVETLDTNQEIATSKNKESVSVPVIHIEENPTEDAPEVRSTFSAINPIPKDDGQKDDHFNPSVRIVIVPKLPDGSCGFHLTRSKWDPYPYISGIDKDSPSEFSGVKIGDCVLEVNSEDVLGMRILEVANLVKSKSDHVSLLLWNTNLEPVCSPDSICCGPMPISLDRLASSMQAIITAIECPVCLDTIPPPVTQCQNGHMLCMKCRMKSDRCPVCRDRYSLARCLLAEQVYTSLVSAFNLEESPDGSIREKIFGARANPPRQKIELIENTESSMTAVKAPSHTQKFLARIMGKACSVDNLAAKNLLNANNVLKHSLSTSEIPRSDSVPISVRRCPSANRMEGDLNSSLGSLVVRRRPVSCNASYESLSSSMPRIDEEKFYCCPAGEHCNDKLRESRIMQHVNINHQLPTISFGTSSAEIALPPRTPIDNASLILVEDSKQFWLRLIVDTNNDLFISCLMQSTPDNCANFVLEVIVRKSNADKILAKELITRNEIYCLETKSWQDVMVNKEGVLISNESIQTTFPDTEVLLKASIRRRHDI